MAEQGDKRPDMVNRDPNNLNDNLSVVFEDIFGEPDGVHSPECAWNCAYKCYEGARKCCYMVLTVLCSWLCGLCWGCEFACVSFAHVYEWTPTLRQMQIVCGIYQKFYETCINCCLGPCCGAIGMLFSNIKVTQG